MIAVIMGGWRREPRVRSPFTWHVLRLLGLVLRRIHVRPRKRTCCRVARQFVKPCTIAQRSTAITTLVHLWKQKPKPAVHTEGIFCSIICRLMLSRVKMCYFESFHRKDLEMRLTGCIHQNTIPEAQTTWEPRFQPFRVFSLTMAFSLVNGLQRVMPEKHTHNGWSFSETQRGAANWVHETNIHETESEHEFLDRQQHNKSPSRLETNVIEPLQVPLERWRVTHSLPLPPTRARKPPGATALL